MNPTFHLPTHLLIGPYRWEVRLISSELASAKKVFGLCDVDTRIISIDESLSPDKLLDTVLHEILHAVYYTQNLLPSRDEEYTVTSLSRGLTAVLLLNPSLSSFIHACHQSFQRVPDAPSPHSPSDHR